MPAKVNIQVLVVIMAFVPLSFASSIMNTVYLNPGASIEVEGRRYGTDTLRTYCYIGKPFSLLDMFETMELIVNIQNSEYTEYGGRTPEEVLKHFNEMDSVKRFNLFSEKHPRMQISPNEQHCVGVETKEPYKVELKHIRFDLFRLKQLIVGIIIVCSASRLAKNTIFYYIAGMVLGICASLVVIITITAKLLPRHPLMYGVLIGGWTIGFYILKQLMDNMRLILVNYSHYLLGYIAFTGFTSLLICYRIGPPRNPRSQNIVKWVLQASGAALVYFSNWHTRVTIAILVLTFMGDYVPLSGIFYLKKKYRRRFPPKRRLLSVDEYNQQSLDETTRSLAELREYVNSPNCQQWNLMRRLRNPMQFANFANGEPHLDEEEIEDYSRTIEEEFDLADDVDDEYFQMHSTPQHQQHDGEYNGNDDQNIDIKYN
ncbi:nuclear envelope integral membrane protein 1-like [Scaptodrosophila lebanonensis]|uniref:Nuclear envelope integral membrane protein 1-like n=1 Tax=Drosophila lebanonensis TaxID=7225 RepID=A0A6J2TYS8_DROLE|nr:nuclear envelope integral membrane protein 1-like [Scaptodrosophila lebanonensis]